MGPIFRAGNNETEDINNDLNNISFMPINRVDGYI